MPLRGLDYLQSPTKRSLDVLGALAIGAGASPIIASAMLATSIESALETSIVNPLFKQMRRGEGSRPFEIFKLRTLRPTPLENDEALVFGTYHPRATRVGQLLRRTAIDELPQIVNVLGGSMSIVGFRPRSDYELDRTEDAAEPTLFNDWMAAYNSAKPGLSGPGQLVNKQHMRARTKEVLVESLKADLTYLDEASVWEDIKIIANTPATLLRGNLHPLDSPTDS